jgi:hypothetical protein
VSNRAGVHAGRFRPSWRSILRWGFPGSAARQTPTRQVAELDQPRWYPQLSVVGRRQAQDRPGHDQHSSWDGSSSTHCLECRREGLQVHHHVLNANLLPLLAQKCAHFCMLDRCCSFIVEICSLYNFVTAKYGVGYLGRQFWSSFQNYLRA